MLKNKKGQVLDGLGSLAVGIATLAILLTVAFMVMSEGKDQAVGLIDSTTYHTNKTLTDSQNVTLTECISDENVNVESVHNSSTEEFLLNSGNYTVFGNIINVTCSYDCAAIKTINFTCKFPSAAYNSTGTLQNATQEIPGWVSLIIIAVIGGLLLSLVAMFRRRN